jgi:hypothetical protein
MTQLAQVSELADYLGRNIPEDSARARLILELVSAEMERYAGQRFAYVADDDVRFRGNWKRILDLPMRPVWAVSLVEVTAPGGAAVPQAAGTWTVDRLGKLEVVVSSGYWGGPSSVVRVKYSHGYALSSDQLPNPNPLGVELLPDELKGVCLSASSRTWTNPTAEAQETIGQAYSVTHGSPAGGIKLNDEEKAVLDGYALRI